MENKKNKIDSAIDEVLESKRLRQGANIAKKSLRIILVIGVFLITTASVSQLSYTPWRPYIALGSGIIAAIIVFILTKKYKDYK